MQCRAGGLIEGLMGATVSTRCSQPAKGTLGIPVKPYNRRPTTSRRRITASHADAHSCGGSGQGLVELALDNGRANGAQKEHQPECRMASKSPASESHQGVNTESDQRLK